MDKKKFLEKYRNNIDAIWIRCKLSNGDEFNCETFDEWMDVKKRCDNEQLFPDELLLQFRSHEVNIDLENVQGIYLIRSAMGKIGQKTKSYITIGTIKDGIVHKKMYITPELIVEHKYEDPIENCFEEAILYDKTKKN
jgi:hypothetical protein